MYIFKLFYFVILNQELMPILTFCDFSRPGFNKILTHLNCSYMLNLLGLVKQWKEGVRVVTPKNHSFLISTFLISGLDTEIYGNEPIPENRRYC